MYIKATCICIFKRGLANMSAQHYSWDINTTPSRKRKRQCDHIEKQQSTIHTSSAPASCFTNDAFSSTPKKIVARRRFQLNKNKENLEPHPNGCAETKPIAENKYDTSQLPQNPFEVIRKPPKKKKRNTEALACFENPALNLDFPEKQLNPYEVVREVTSNKKSNCFSNPALNLKVHDASILCNPFEVQRQAPNHETLNIKLKAVSNNPFIISSEVKEELTPKPCQLKLGLPFTPKVGCRIDFRNVSISQLTPSKLLAEKLVFSPEQRPKLSLDIIHEESPMDIGKELDRYQLELENSINEAKLHKTGAAKEKVYLPPDINCVMNSPFKDNSKLTQKLYAIPENVKNEQIIEEQTEHTFNSITKVDQTTNTIQNNLVERTPFQYNINKPYQKTETAEVVAIENIDDLYDSCASDEESFDFKSAQFVRAYKKQEQTKLTVSKESQGSSKCKDDENELKKSLNVKNIVRRSIRKFVNNHQDCQRETKAADNVKKETEHEKQKGFMNAIRSSFRRKPAKSPDEEYVMKNQSSIIDYSERTMKLKTDALSSDYMNVEDLTNEKSANLRSSIRKTTREVRNQILKSVFNKKHEEYEFRK